MRKAVGILALCAFAGGALLSLALLGTAVHEGGPGMPHCPLMPAQAVICTMTALDHIAAWQGMFTGIPQSALLLLLVLVAVLLVRPYSPALARSPSQIYASRSREPLIRLSPLAELLARGILNPKLY